MPPSCPRFRLVDFVRPPRAYHYARVQLTPFNHARYHDHDYHEVFWVTHGRGQHRWNETSAELRSHQLFLIHPRDRHCVSTDNEDPLGIINVAFPSAVWAKVRQRYFENVADPFETETADRMFPLDAGARATLEFWARRLDQSECPAVALEGFLMDLPQFTRPPVSTPGLPDWLDHACREIRSPEHFQEGTAGFVRLAGRTPSHVARATRRWLERSPSEIVNAARMDYAARQLVSTPRPILDIALDCGLANLSHFYARFRQTYGTSPRRYRLRATSPVNG